MAKEVYCCIKQAIDRGELKEPFNSDDFRNICKDEFKENTYKTFLNKHKLGNGKETELFKKNENEKTYILIRPFKYDCINGDVI